MFRSRFSKIIIVSSGIVVVTAILIVLFSEAEFLLAKISWHRKFEQELLRNGEVRLADLVNFKWDMIYLLESYSTLDTEKEAKLFPATSWSDPFCWRGDVRYWTIAYQRPGTSPFLVKFQKNVWSLRGLTNGATTDPDAKLKVVPADTVESTYCTRPHARCLALVDSRSKTPTGPLNKTPIELLK